MLSTLLLTVTFLMSIFMISQYFVGQEASGKDSALKKLTRQIAELTELAMARQLPEAADNGVDRVHRATADQALDSVAELFQLERRCHLGGVRLGHGEDRIDAQRAIERVYYGHTVGTRVSFETAVTDEMLEELAWARRQAILVKIPLWFLVIP